MRESVRACGAICVALVWLALGGTATAGPWKQYEPHVYDVQAGPGVTSQGWISDFHEPLAGTIADSPYFVLEGAEPGGTLFVLGGTHPSEPSGIVAAILLVETAVVQRGRLVVVPYGNSLAMTPDERAKLIQTETGERRLVHGIRRSLLHLHEPDPDGRYRSPTGGSWNPNEARNLNRIWPGLPHGTGTEQIGYAITEIIRHYQADVAMDLHEALDPWGTLAWTLAGTNDHDALIREASRRANAGLELDLIAPRFISDTTTSMSMAEWEAATGVIGLLTETVRDSHTPIHTRVGIQIEFVTGLLNAFNAEHPDRAVQLGGVPGYLQIRAHGMDSFFLPAQ